MIVSALLLVAPVVKVQQLLVELNGRRVLEQLGDRVQLLLCLLVHPVAAAATAGGRAVGFPLSGRLLLGLFDRRGDTHVQFA